MRCWARRSCWPGLDQSRRARRGETPRRRRAVSSRRSANTEVWIPLSTDLLSLFACSRPGRSGLETRYSHARLWRAAYEAPKHGCASSLDQGISLSHWAGAGPRGAMSLRRFARLARWLEELFPERHLYLRSGGEMRGYVLTSKKQLLMASGVAAAALWMGVTTAATLVTAFTPSKSDQEVAKTEARYERWIADRDARLSSAVAQLNASGGSFQDLASTVEKRHAALALLLTDIRGAPGAAQALLPALAVASPAQASPAQRIQTVQQDQDRLIDAGEAFGKNRA